MALLQTRHHAVNDFDRGARTANVNDRQRFRYRSYRGPGRVTEDPVPIGKTPKRLIEESDLLEYAGSKHGTRARTDMAASKHGKTPVGFRFQWTGLTPCGIFAL